MLILEGALYVPSGYTFTCGGWGHGLSAWATCSDSWRVKGQCALAVFTVPLSLHNTLETHQHSRELTRKEVY